MGHKNNKGGKQPPRAANVADKAVAGDELDRAQLMAVFSQHPLTTMNLLRFMLYNIDETHYQAPAPVVLHGAVGQLLMESVVGMADGFESHRDGPVEVWQAFASLISVHLALIAAGYLNPRKSSLPQPQEMALLLEWNDGFNKDKHPKAHAALQQLIGVMRDTALAQALYRGKPAAPAAETATPETATPVEAETHE